MADEPTQDEPARSVVVRNDLEHRYEIRLGDRLAGFAAYREHGDRTVFTHTEIGEEFGGKGLGGVLAENALRDVIERRHTIVPVCPFIAAYLRKHPEYEEHVSWPEAEAHQADEPAAE